MECEELKSSTPLFEELVACDYSEEKDWPVFRLCIQEDGEESVYEVGYTRGLLVWRTWNENRLCTRTSKAAPVYSDILIPFIQNWKQICGLCMVVGPEAFAHYEANGLFEACPNPCCDAGECSCDLDATVCGASIANYEPHQCGICEGSEQVLEEGRISFPKQKITFRRRLLAGFRNALAEVRFSSLLESEGRAPMIAFEFQNRGIRGFILPLQNYEFVAPEMKIFSGAFGGTE
jgi:hypothetical protein